MKMKRCTHRHKNGECWESDLFRERGIRREEREECWECWLIQSPAITAQEMQMPLSEEGFESAPARLVAGSRRARYGIFGRCSELRRGSSHQSGRRPVFQVQIPPGSAIGPAGEERAVLTLAKDKNETYGSPICRWEASATSQHYASLIARLAKESQAFTLAVS